MQALIASVVLLQAASGSAPQSSDAEVMIPRDYQLDWLRRPDAFDLGRAYPAHANGASGRVSLRCQVTVKGSLDNCRIMEEAPLGHGFGEEALALSHLFRIRTTDPSGRSAVGMWLNLPFRLTPPR